LELNEPEWTGRGEGKYGMRISERMKGNLEDGELVELSG